MKEVENDTQSEYELTSLGLLPKNWSVVQFSQIADFNLGRTPPRITQEYWDQGKYPWVSIKDMDTFGRIQKTKEKISSIALKDIFRNSCVPKGTLLMSFKLTIGKTSILDIDAVHNEAIISIFPYDTILKEFLLYYLPTIDYSEYFDKAVKGNTLNKSKIRRILIPLPPLPEQRAIAHLLRTVQEAREKTEAVIEAAKTLKKSMMQYLFTYGPVPIDEAEQVPLKETKYGTIPKSWDKIELKELAYIQTGIAKGRKIEESECIELPYLRVANVQDGYLDLSEMKTIKLRINEIERFKLRKGDVVVTEGGDFDKLGRGFIWRDQIRNCVHQNHIFAIRMNNEMIIPEYLAYLFQSEYGKKYFLEVGHRTTHLACINKTKLSNFPVILPNNLIQEQIVQILSFIDKKITAEESRKAALDQLFQTLLHDLMTAKIRVDHISVPVAET